MKSEQQSWTEVYTTHSMAYPCEYVIRIFKGRYPNLDFDKSLYPYQKVLDIGCGDGRNLPMLSRCGLDCYGVEIADEIVSKTKKSLMDAGVNADIRTGSNANLPFEDCTFDYVLSWNVCYYMGSRLDFHSHVQEYARVLKKGAILVLSIPKKTCFIYKGCKPFIADNGEKYAVIKKDPFEIRNGISLKIFDGEEDIQKTFSPYFDNFTFASIHDDCFGFDYHWHLAVCKKK